MSFERPTPTWTTRDMDRILTCLDVLERSDLPLFAWTTPPDEVIDGVVTKYWPSTSYHPQVDRIWELLYQSSAYIDPYAPLPEDPRPFDANYSLFEVHADRAAFIASASLDQLRRYLVWCTRGERFCTGFFAGELESGHFLAALRRVRGFREQRRRRRRP